ncbi:hypothetical protein DSO57_1025306 [Entomophthora muscae]|uniref:Uncharacterized protein n=1 Tax=Entomophthora muscae TaxID=34485 RepID=A0ACC2S4B4_9FUNG|nr:hypothetical protein DSO57_1025306 [Entomophthora muscae]
MSPSGITLPSRISLVAFEICVGGGLRVLGLPDLPRGLLLHLLDALLSGLIEASFLQLVLGVTCVFSLGFSWGFHISISSLVVSWLSILSSQESGPSGLPSLHLLMGIRSVLLFDFGSGACVCLSILP